MTLLAWNCRVLGTNVAIRILTDEVKATDPTLVFLVKTKAGVNWIKGVQRKLEYSQGIIVPSDRRSGGLALLWKEGTVIDFKSCLNSHIDVVVRESPSFEPRRAIGFYGQPETNKRYISWHLLDSLSTQCNMP